MELLLGQGWQGSSNVVVLLSFRGGAARAVVVGLVTSVAQRLCAATHTFGSGHTRRLELVFVIVPEGHGDVTKARRQLSGVHPSCMQGGTPLPSRCRAAAEPLPGPLEDLPVPSGDGPLTVYLGSRNPKKPYTRPRTGPVHGRLCGYCRFPKY